MNKERLLKLADVVEKGHHKFNGIHAAFDMSAFFDSAEDNHMSNESFSKSYVPQRDDIEDPFACNSIACIAGFACLLFDYENSSSNENRSSFEDRARELLDLSWKKASDLFLTYTNSDVTGAEAASVIRNFAETGVVDWLPVMDKHVGLSE